MSASTPVARQGERPHRRRAPGGASPGPARRCGRGGRSRRDRPASVSAPAATSPSGPAPTPAGAPTSAPAAPPTYLVAPGDSLWSIAEHLYGDGADWQELAALNLGHLMDDGRRFTDPSLILPGWRLALPDDGSTAAATPAAAPGAAPTQPASPAPVGPAVPSAAGASTESASDTTVPAPALGSPTRAPLRSESLGGLAGPVVPELAALGIGVLAAALAARRIRRARRIAAPADGAGCPPHRRPTRRPSSTPTSSRSHAHRSSIGSRPPIGTSAGRSPTNPTRSPPSLRCRSGPTGWRRGFRVPSTGHRGAGPSPVTAPVAPRSSHRSRRAGTRDRGTPAPAACAGRRGRQQRRHVGTPPRAGQLHAGDR